MEPRIFLSSLDIAYISIYGLSALLGLFLNTLTITILLKGKKFGKGIRIQLVNLAVADTLSSLVVFIFAIFEGLLAVPNINVYVILDVCGILHYFLNFQFQASLMSNTAISLERFVAVYFPLKIREYRRRHVIAVTIAIWILTFVVDMPWIFEIELHADPSFNKNHFCTSELFLEPVELDLIIYSTCYFFPLTIIVTSYTLICIKLKRRRQIGDHHTVNQQHAQVLLTSFKLVT